MTSTSRGWAMLASVTAAATLSVAAGVAVHGNTASGARPAAIGGSVSPLAVRAMAAAGTAAKPAAAGDARDCVYGVSKDVCEGKLRGDREYTTGCDAGPIPCRTYHLDDAKLDLGLNSSNLTCSTTVDSRRGRCDEFGDETSGRFDGRVSLILRQQEPCRFRGTIDGDATYTMNNGAVFSGRLIGLIGAGADRTPACHTEVHTGNCENCLDIQFVADVDPSYWRLGTEIIFDGVRTDAPTGERLRLNISGSFTSPGGRDGPEKLNDYRFVGTADGVEIFVCN